MSDRKTFKFIAVDGPPGAGKTALAHILAERLNARLIVDQIPENPFLEKFYADMRRYALHTQISSLLSRYKQQAEIAQPDLFHPVTITDYTSAKDEVFAQLNLSPEEYRLYSHLRSALTRNFPKPELVLLLQAHSDILHQRLMQREKSASTRLQRAYLDKIIDAYGTHFLHYEASPVLILDVDHLDLERQRFEVDALLKEMEQLQSGRKSYAPNIL